MSDFDRVARAITYVAERVREQPTLAEVAAHVGLSPSHFQRVFSRWAGISPKRFLQALTTEHGKAALAAGGPLLEVADAVGLSGPSRLHDHFVHLEAVTPGEFRSRGEGLVIHQGVHDTPFGRMAIGVTSRGICRAAFVDTGVEPFEAALRADWPRATIVDADEETRPIAQQILRIPAACDRPLSLYVAGTNFQIAVWRALLSIPPMGRVSYSAIAKAVGYPGAARAIGNAVGANPVALVIPCHRVIRESGALGGYRWGVARKRAILAWERARAEEASSG